MRAAAGITWGVLKKPSVQAAPQTMRSASLGWVPGSRSFSSISAENPWVSMSEEAIPLAGTLWELK